jgi:hypothetical protein
LLRKNKTAASEKARLRYALPIFVPEVPYRIVESLVIEVNQGEVDFHGLRKSGSALR